MRLTSERLVLREFEEDDWQAVRAYQSDPRYLRYNDWTQRTERDVRDFVQRFIRWREEQPRSRYQFAITLPPDGQLIGNCGIRREAPAARVADIGYELDPRYWGHGYATEAVQRILRFGFAELELHRIWAWCVAENSASAHVLEKIGMRQEGYLRENEWLQGRWWDTRLYAMLEQEWKMDA